MFFNQKKHEEEEESETSEGRYKENECLYQSSWSRLQIIWTPFSWMIRMEIILKFLSFSAPLLPSIDKKTRGVFHISFLYDCVNCMFKNSLTVDYCLCNTAPPFEVNLNKGNYRKFTLEKNENKRNSKSKKLKRKEGKECERKKKCPRKSYKLRAWKSSSWKTPQTQTCGRVRQKFCSPFDSLWSFLGETGRCVWIGKGIMNNFSFFSPKNERKRFVLDPTQLITYYTQS